MLGSKASISFVSQHCFKERPKKMKHKILHIFVTLLCLAALIKISIFCYECFFSMQNVTLFRKINTGFATLGWLLVFWEELTKWRVTNWLVRTAKKYRK